MLYFMKTDALIKLYVYVCLQDTILLVINNKNMKKVKQNSVNTK